MESPKFRPLYAALKTVASWCVCCGLAGSQEGPTPPTPHREPVLPGTRVPPQPILQKRGIVLRIDAPVSVSNKKCAEHTFNIKYSVLNNTSKPANGTVQATFNGASLMPAGSVKLDGLAPGKTVSGTFSACCPAQGSFAARMDYRDEPSTTHPYSVSDSVNISCK